MTPTTKNKVEFEHGGKTYVAEHRSRDWRERRVKGAKGFCFGPGDDRNPSLEFRFLAEHVGAPGVYTNRGEFPALDKAFDKMNREIVAAKKEVFEAALVALGFQPERGDFSFSRSAGCPCGCSPGFNLRFLPQGETVYVNEKKGEVTPE